MEASDMKKKIPALLITTIIAFSFGLGFAGCKEKETIVNQPLEEEAEPIDHVIDQ